MKIDLDWLMGDQLSGKQAAWFVDLKKEENWSKLIEIISSVK